MPEVSDQDAAVVRMIQEMDTDPEVRLGLRKLIKQKYPKTFIPEVDVPAREMARIKPQLDEVTNLRNEFTAYKNKETTEREGGKVVGSTITAEERPAVEKLMTDRLIGDVATAAKVYKIEAAETAEAAAPPRMGPAPIEWPQNRFKGLTENPNQWARTEDYAALQDIQQGKVSA